MCRNELYPTIAIWMEKTCDETWLKLCTCLRKHGQPHIGKNTTMYLYLGWTSVSELKEPFSGKYGFSPLTSGNCCARHETHHDPLMIYLWCPSMATLLGVGKIPRGTINDNQWIQENVTIIAWWSWWLQRYLDSFKHYHDNIIIHIDDDDYV